MNLSKLDDWCVDTWRDILKWWSARMIVIGGIIGSIMTLMPALPPEIQALIPVEYRVAAVALWSVATLIARALKQKKLSG